MAFGELGEFFNLVTKEHFKLNNTRIGIVRGPKLIPPSS
jgi:hypothetical protein